MMDEPIEAGQGLFEALAALAARLGRPLSATALRATVVRARDGHVDWPSLHAALSGFGLVLRQVDAAPATLAPDAFPVVAVADDGRFAVCDDAGTHTRTADWCLRLVSLPATDARQAHAPPRARAWFGHVLWRLRGYYAHVALATLVVNLLALALPLYVMNVYDRVVPNRTYETLWVLTVGVALALGFELLARTLRGWLLDAAGRRADAAIADALVDRLLSIRLDARPASAGAFVSELRDFEAIRDVLTSATLTTLVDLPFVLLFVAVIFAIAPPLAVVPAVALAAVLVLGLLAQAPLARSIRATMAESAQRQGLAVEAVEGLETLKASNAYRHVRQRWSWLTETIAAASLRARTLSGLVVNLTGTAAQLVTVVSVAWGTYLIHAGTLSLGGLIAVVILAGRAVAPVGQVSALAVRLQQARSAFAGLQALLDRPVEREPGRVYLTLPAARGSLALARVDFSHEPGGSPLLRGFDLAIGAGEKVALLGRTGCGKTTLLRLAAGLLAPGSGAVLLDGIDVRQVDPAELRGAIGLLPQHPRIFRGTLRENLDIGRADRPHDDARLAAVLRAFGLDALIAAHPRGLDMPLGEGGLGLSGGQCQLVALARLALRDPRVALLDEPTAGLDQTSEQAVLRALADWGRDRTMVIVTHRPPPLSLVERVVVVDGGRVLLDGPRGAVIEQLARGVPLAPTAGTQVQHAPG